MKQLKNIFIVFLLKARAFWKIFFFSKLNRNSTRIDSHRVASLLNHTLPDDARVDPVPDGLRILVDNADGSVQVDPVPGIWPVHPVNLTSSTSNTFSPNECPSQWLNFLGLKVWPKLLDLIHIWFKLKILQLPPV